MGENKIELKRKRVKILVPIIILLFVAGIFLLKNANSGNLIDSENESNIEITGENAQESDDKFRLDATYAFDLDAFLSHGLPVIIDLGSESCGPCRAMAPELQELNADLRGTAVVKYVDIGKDGQAATMFPLRVIPTQFFFDKEGQPYVPETVDLGFIIYRDEETQEHIYTAHEGALTKEEMLSILKELGVE